MQVRLAGTIYIHGIYSVFWLGDHQVYGHVRSICGSGQPLTFRALVPSLPSNINSTRPSHVHTTRRYLLESEIVVDFFEKVEVANFEVASDAFSTFKVSGVSAADLVFDQ